MNGDHSSRKLTTILAPDVEGYSRLMGHDEEATLRTLKSYREIIDALIVRHEGRIFSTGGDSVLAEFGSAVEEASRNLPTKYGSTPS
jgi:adenylate cyclase